MFKFDTYKQSDEGTEGRTNIIIRVVANAYFCSNESIFVEYGYDLYFMQGLLNYRTCKPDFLRSWPSLNSYRK